MWDINKTSDLLPIAVEVVSGEMAAGRGGHENAIGHLEKAVEMQDNLNYDEPPPWHYPVRHSLGAVLLEAGRVAEAERVYREDLERFPENGWALLGLRQSLKAQGKSKQANEIGKRFDQAWQYADVTLSASRF